VKRLSLYTGRTVPKV